MPSPPIFAVATDKIGRAKTEMSRLDAYLDAYQRAGFDDVWSRTATIAFALHAVDTAIEDVMSDVATTIDGHMPQGAAWHQALLDQMHVVLDGRRPAVLDDELYIGLIELKSFRHLVRHHYGIDLDPGKTEAKLGLMRTSLQCFEDAIMRLAATMTGG